VDVTLIAAMDENRLIGTGEGGLPWRGIERDRAHFRAYTAGKALLLGRRTFEEMSGWFDDGHRPAVVSRDGSYRAEGGYPVVGSVSDGVDRARAAGETELVVCGGATVYAAAMEFATQLVLTVLHERFDLEGGAHFPPWEGAGFVEMKREWFGPADGAPGMTFLWLTRG